MKKFVVLYHAPGEALAESASSTPEEMAEGMKPWMDWAEKCGNHLIDLGNPLMGGQKLFPDGKSENSQRQVCGYSILQADDMDHAKSLLEGHPHLKWRGDCEIEVHEVAPLPGSA